MRYYDFDLQKAQDSGMILHPEFIRDSSREIHSSVAMDRLVSILAGETRFASVNSRVSPRSGTGTPWVVMTEAILKKMRETRTWMIGSIGVLQYDFSLYTWLRLGGKCLVITESCTPFRKDPGNDAYRYFFRHPDILWISLGNHSKKLISTKESKVLRDRFIVALSHEIVPCHVSKAGNMATLLRSYAENGGRILAPAPDPSSQKEAFSKRSDPLYREDSHHVPGTYSEREVNFGNYLWHYTRSRNTPWPGEGWVTYLEGLAGRGPAVPYTALDALQRILVKQCIRGSSHLIRGGHRVVCLTETPLDQMKSLFHYQKHLRRQRFEPAAIGIRKDVLKKRGARSVIYGPERLYSTLPPADRFRFQRYEPPGVDWRDEREWRIQGDLDFAGIGREDRMLIAGDHSAALRLRRLTKTRIVIPAA